MSRDILVFAEHLQGAFTEATFELLAVARRTAAATGGSVQAAVLGSSVGGLAGELGGADTVLVVDHPALETFDPTAHAAVFAELVADRGPAIVLVPYTAEGMEIGGVVSVREGLPLVSFCREIRVDGGLAATCQLYAGKIEADVSVDGERAVFAMLSGAAPAAEGRAGGAGTIETVVLPVPESGVHALGIVEPEAGDVDITAQEVLVAVGRGIESEDNIAEAEELASALGGAVAASRPVVDQGWLPKSRQVGKSGSTVRPKVYLALGISGAPEHVEGMRDAETIIAVNSDPQAPIFGTAHYGWVGDLFDLLPELVDRLG